jgi:predicted transcriptional regulator of viral defense system
LSYYAYEMSRIASRRKLFETAQAQSGFFTTRQAVAVGFASNTHPYHVRSGNWFREHRGIYRLADYPTPERPDLMIGYLWSRDRHENPQGVYSHETALSLYELSDANPRKLHMTVPRKFRRMAPAPPMIVLHRADIPPEDTQETLGVRCTTPMRTLIDLAAEQRTDTVLRQAVHEALSRGLVRRSEFERKDLPPQLRREFEAVARTHA